MLYPTFSTIQKEEKAIVCDHLFLFLHLFERFFTGNTGYERLKNRYMIVVRYLIAISSVYLNHFH